MENAPISSNSLWPHTKHKRYPTSQKTPPFSHVAHRHFDINLERFLPKDLYAHTDVKGRSVFALVAPACEFKPTFDLEINGNFYEV